MKNSFILLMAFIVLLAGCNKPTDKCTESWFADDNVLIKEQTKNCAINYNGKRQPKTYKQIKDKWYLVEITVSVGDCGFLQKCYHKDTDYYLISNDKDHFLPLEHGYSKDSQAVYYHQYLIKGADPNTFKVLNDHYSVDKNSVFIKNLKIEGANVESFVPFEKNPEQMSGLWAHDNKYLYLNHQKIPIELDMANFHYVSAYIYTDGKKILKQDRNNTTPETRFKLREDITLPLTRISTSSFIDGKQRLFINTQQGKVEQIHNIDGSKIKVIEPTCSIKDYPHLKLNCSTEEKTYSDDVFFEDGKQVYLMRTEFAPYVSYLGPIFERKKNKPVYLLIIDHSHNLIHDGILYGSIFDYKKTPRFPSTQIDGELFGVFPTSSSTIADNGGFISLHSAAHNDPTKLLRSFTKDEFGQLHLAKKQYGNAYVLENDRYFYILFKERTAQNLYSYIVDKKEKTVKEMGVNDGDITDYSGDLLEGLGLKNQ